VGTVVLAEHQSSPWVLVRFVAFYVVFCERLFLFLSGHCIVSLSSFYSFWYPLVSYSTNNQGELGCSARTTVPTPLITRVNSGVLQGQQFPLH
jgi:hypothetical protein